MDYVYTQSQVYVCTSAVMHFVTLHPSLLLYGLKLLMKSSLSAKSQEEL